MKHLSMAKKTILFQISTGYLFWTSCIFFILKFSDEHNIIISCSENLSNDKKFVNLVQKLNIKVFYYPHGNIFLRHFRLKKHFSNLVSLCNIDELYMHNFSFMHNSSLMNSLFKLENYPTIYAFQSSRLALDRELDFKIIDNLANIRLNKIKQNFLFFFPKILNLRKSILFFLNFKFFPFIASGQTYSPVFNIYFGSLISKNLEYWHNTMGATLLCYYETEAKFHRKLGIPVVDVIKHPGSEEIVQKKYLSIIGFRKDSNSKTIAILPSLLNRDAFSSTYRNYDNLEETIANEWKKIIFSLKEIFPNYKILFKSHPSSSQSIFWINIMKFINQQQDDSFKVLNKEEDATPLILSSDIIIGDSSTTIWLAGLLNRPKIFSVRVLENLVTREMKNLSKDIIYCENTEVFQQKIKNVNNK